LREAAKVCIGGKLTIIVSPTATLKALARAREQSKLTTAPKKGRADALEPPRGCALAR
jgi:hypothetical protein